MGEIVSATISPLLRSISLLQSRGTRSPGQSTNSAQWKRFLRAWVLATDSQTITSVPLRWPSSELKQASRAPSGAFEPTTTDRGAFGLVTDTLQHQRFAVVILLAKCAG